ncbi:cysteine proteinase [Martensiomyces pterosporus]|nr:cysteine proteinase [Martensiomyces pterosporus]
MPNNWASAVKTGIQKTPAAPLHERATASQQISRDAYANSVAVPQIEPDAQPPVTRFGDIAISIHKYPLDTQQLPLFIPPDPEFWERLHRERRRRKEAKNGNKAAEPQKPKPASWAALLRKESAAATSTAANGIDTNGGSSPLQGANGAQRHGTASGVLNPGEFTTLEDALIQWRVVFGPPPVQPRGLVNTGNMCFMNVVLQALLYCAPFYNMLWTIKEKVAFSFKTETPLLEALIQYVHEFKQDQTPLAHLETELDEPFVPENVYEALRKKNVFQTLRGQQEDAQEFMSYLVDGIHEEMVTILQTCQVKKTRLAAEATAKTHANGAQASGNGEWLEIIGPNNKPSYVRDNNDSVVRTPITQIFGGTLRSTLTIPSSVGGSQVYGGGRIPQSSNKEPFQWLALDISSGNVGSIEDAFDDFVAPEVIEGYMNLQGEAVNATKQILLEGVPPVLVLHLKRFVFCPNEGVQKVHKFIEYPATLSLSPKWFARTPEASKFRNARYKLTGVIYHHGSHASGGHYTCDVLRSANEWLRFDDVDIDCLSSVDDALEEKKDRTAYILFYTVSH